MAEETKVTTTETEAETQEIPKLEYEFTQEELDKMTYADLLVWKKHVNNDIAEFSSMNEVVKNIQSFYANTENPEILKSTSMENSKMAGMAKDVKTWNDTYPKLQAKMLQCLHNIDQTMTAKFGDVSMKIKFMDDELYTTYTEALKAMNEKIEKDEYPNGVAKASAIRVRDRINVRLQAIQDRQTMNFWLNKSSHAGSVLALLKSMDWKGNKSITEDIETIAKILNTNSTQVTIMYVTLAAKYGIISTGSKTNTMSAQQFIPVRILFHHIARILTRGVENGEDMYGMVMAQTIYAASSNNWDYDSDPYLILSEILNNYKAIAMDRCSRRYGNENFFYDVHLLEVMTKAANKIKTKAPFVRNDKV